MSHFAGKWHEGATLCRAQFEMERVEFGGCLTGRRCIQQLIFSFTTIEQVCFSSLFMLRSTQGI